MVKIDSEYFKRIRSGISKIMFENKEMFDIVTTILNASKNISPEEIEFYVRQTIERRIGLEFIIDTIMGGVEEIKWTIPTAIINDVRNSAILRILQEYMSMSYGPGIQKEYKKLEQVVKKYNF